MEYLVFQLYSPLISWGDIAVGGERQSALSPSKSAITGLIGAALGIRREEEERLTDLTNSIHTGVKLFSSGTLLKDFHTIQVPASESKVIHKTRRDELKVAQEKLGTALSKREYRCDSFALVAVWLQEGEYSLQDICKALREPKFHLYFGRKSCPPALPLNPQVLSADSLKNTLDTYEPLLPLPLSKNSKPWEETNYKKPIECLLGSEQIYYFWEECSHSGFSSYLQKSVRYDKPTSRKRWQFTSRDEYMFIEREPSHVH